MRVQGCCFIARQKSIFKISWSVKQKNCPKVQSSKCKYIRNEAKKKEYCELKSICANGVWCVKIYTNAYIRITYYIYINASIYIYTYYNINQGNQSCRKGACALDVLLSWRDLWRTSQSIDPTRCLFMLFAAPEQWHLDEQLFWDVVAARVGAYIAMHGHCKSSDAFEGAMWLPLGLKGCCHCGNQENIWKQWDKTW